MSDLLTKATLRAAFGSDAAIAAFFGISRAAVAQWTDNEPIPELRQLQAERKRPDLFTAERHPLPRDPAAPDGSAAAETAAPVPQVGEAA